MLEVSIRPADPNSSIANEVDIEKDITDKTKKNNNNKKEDE